MARIHDLEMAIARAKREMETAQAELDGIRSRCKHVWDEPDGAYMPIRTKGYRDPGDVPGTMGVDFRGPSYVPATETARWVRVCTVCGLVESTTQVEKVELKKPRW